MSRGRRSLRGSAAIVGAAESDLGVALEGMSAEDLMAQGSMRALSDAGLELSDIDGVFTSSTQLNMAALSLSEYLGISPRYMDSTQIGGSSFMAHVNHAQAALTTGLCDVALVAYGSTQRSQGRDQAAPQEISPYEFPFKPRLPMAAYALAASRHMHEFGTSREHLAEVAVAAREWARLNPKAWHQDPLSLDDVLAAPMISSPFGRLDCCLITDGGGALVMVSAERAGDLRHSPVFVLGAGEVASHRHISSMPDLVVTGAQESGRRAYAAAGLRPDDIDVVELYDAFTINTLLFLEDLGFCDKGDAGPFVADGRIRPGGDLPVNTNGGGLSYCHPGMYGLLLLIEGVRQLRGECGERQVDGAHTALVHGSGGVLSSQSTVILGDATTV